MSKFSVFRKACNQAKNIKPFSGTLLALDPGETTGWASFSATNEVSALVDQGQIKTWPQQDMVEQLTKLYDHVKPDLVVHELYTVYDWKTDDHAWSQIPTVHVIGCIETLCIQRSIPFISQTAQVAKNFCTDNKLKSWNYYIEGRRHARDAIRHGCYFLLFGMVSK